MVKYRVTPSVMYSVKVSRGCLRVRFRARVSDMV